MVTQETVLAVVLYLLGVAARVFWPYILAYLQDGKVFDWRYVVGQLLVAVVGLFGIMSAPEFLADLGALSFFGVFVFGFGAADIGRTLQKTITGGPTKQ